MKTIEVCLLFCCQWGVLTQTATGPDPCEENVDASRCTSYSCTSSTENGNTIVKIVKCDPPMCASDCSPADGTSESTTTGPVEPSSSTTTSAPVDPSESTGAVVAGALMVNVDQAAIFVKDPAVRTPLQDALAQTLDGVESSWVVIKDISVATSQVRVEFEIAVPANYTPPTQNSVETAKFTTAVVHSLEVIKQTKYTIKDVLVVDVAITVSSTTTLPVEPPESTTLAPVQPTETTTSVPVVSSESSTEQTTAAPVNPSESTTSALTTLPPQPVDPSTSTTTTETMTSQPVEPTTTAPVVPTPTPAPMPTPTPPVPPTPAPGQHTECIGGRAHIIKYNMSAEVDMDTGYPLNFSVSVRPDPFSDDAPDACNPAKRLVGQIHEEKYMCIGVNIDTVGCEKAANAFAINVSDWLPENSSAPDWIKNHSDTSDWLECSNCFLGFHSDLVFDFGWRTPEFHCDEWWNPFSCHVDLAVVDHLNMGFKDMHVRGGLELRAHQEKAWNYTGKYDLPEIHMPPWVFTAGPVPISMDFHIPTALTYELKLEEKSELKVGATVDFDLGDHMLVYQNGDFQTQNTDTKVSWQPVFDAKGEVTATVTLGLESSLEVTVEKLLTWGLNFKPSVPISAGVEAEICPLHSVNHTQMDLCHSVGADFKIDHAASIDFDFFGIHANVANFGPWDLYKNHWDLVPKTCDRLIGDCNSTTPAPDNNDSNDEYDPDGGSTTESTTATSTSQSTTSGSVNPTTDCPMGRDFCIASCGEYNSTEYSTCVHSCESDCSEDEATTQTTTSTTESTTTTTTTSTTTTTTTSTTTTTPGSSTTTPGNCKACMTDLCAPCKKCTSSQDGACRKCWRCWDHDDDEPEDDDDEMDEECDALHPDHDLDADEVRCLHHDMPSNGDGRRRFTRLFGTSGGDGRRRASSSSSVADCRACWAELGEMTMVV